MPSSPSWKTPNVTGGNSSRWRGPRANDFNSGSDAVAVSGPAAPRSTFKDHRPKYSRAMNQPSLGPSSRCKAVHGTHCAVAAPSSLRLYGTATGDCSNLPWLGPALRRRSRIACRTGCCRCGRRQHADAGDASRAGWSPEFSSSTHCRKIGVPGNANTWKQCGSSLRSKTKSSCAAGRPPVLTSFALTRISFQALKSFAPGRRPARALTSR